MCTASLVCPVEVRLKRTEPNLLRLSPAYKKLSRGEICVANIIPPVNGASLASYLVKN